MVVSVIDIIAALRPGQAFTWTRPTAFDVAEVAKRGFRHVRVELEEGGDVVVRHVEAMPEATPTPAPEPAAPVAAPESIPEPIAPPPPASPAPPPPRALATPITLPSPAPTPCPRPGPLPRDTDLEWISLRQDLIARAKELPPGGWFDTKMKLGTSKHAYLQQSALRTFSVYLNLETRTTVILRPGEAAPGTPPPPPRLTAGKSKSLSRPAPAPLPPPSADLPTLPPEALRHDTIAKPKEEALKPLWKPGPKPAPSPRRSLAIGQLSIPPRDLRASVDAGLPPTPWAPPGRLKPPPVDPALRRILP